MKKTVWTLFISFLFIAGLSNAAAENTVSTEEKGIATYDETINPTVSVLKVEGKAAESIYEKMDVQAEGDNGISTKIGTNINCLKDTIEIMGSPKQGPRYICHFYLKRVNESDLITGAVVKITRKQPAD